MDFNTRKIMRIKSVLRVLLFGGSGALIVGFSTGQWFRGMFFCITLASIGEYASFRKKKINSV